jgi:hypothetical protein
MKKLFLQLWKLFLLTLLIGAIFACNSNTFKGRVTNKGAGESIGVSATPTPEPGEGALPVARPVPQFAMLVNDLTCSFCHLQIHGDVVSTLPFEAIHGSAGAENVGKVEGIWFAASNWNPEKADGFITSTIAKTDIIVGGGIKENYQGDEMPKNKSGAITFPDIDFAALNDKMDGSLAAGGVSVDKVQDGNLVVIGTDASPIEIKGSVLIKGDLVIKGIYKGVGTIYVTGNIYVPFDLKAQRSPFPFPEDATEALAKAKKHIKDSDTDALVLATANSVLIADLEKQEQGSTGNSVYNHSQTRPKYNYAGTKALAVYNWYPNGKAGYTQLYGRGYDCFTQVDNARLGSFNLIEAFLYAKHSVSGVARNNSYGINGGIIADGFHIIAASSARRLGGDTRSCPDSDHPIHKRNMRQNHISFDWRMKAGLHVLGAIEEYFKKSE